MKNKVWISVFSSTLPPASSHSPFQTQKFFPMGFCLPFNSSLDDIQINSEGGRKGFLIVKMRFQKLYVFMQKLTKPAERKYESGSSVCCGLVAESCQTQYAQSSWTLSYFQQRWSKPMDF